MEGLTDGTLQAAETAFEAMLTEEETPTTHADEQPEEPVAQLEGDEIEATNEEESVEEVVEESEPEADEFKQWLGELQDSIQDNPELLDELQLNLNVGGEDVGVSFAELKKAQMQEADYTRKTQALAEQRKTAEAEIEANKTAFDTKMQEFAAVTTAVEQQLGQEYSNVNWDELRQLDPAEWSAKRQEFGQRHQEIQQMKQNATQQIQKYNQEQLATQRESAMKTLLTAVPEWSDKAVLEDNFKAIRASATADYGMSDSFVSSVVDPGFILMARDAIAYRQGKQTVKSKAKVLKSVPKFTKPGVKRSSNATNTAKNTQALNRLKKTGTVADAAAAFERFL